MVGVGGDRFFLEKGIKDGQDNFEKELSPRGLKPENVKNVLGNHND